MKLILFQFKLINSKLMMKVYVFSYSYVVETLEIFLDMFDIVVFMKIVGDYYIE